MDSSTLRLSTENPLDNGWVYMPPKDAAFAGAIKAVPGSGWKSPEFPCKPFHYYKITFRSRSEGLTWYAVFYYDKNGEYIVADTYGGIDLSEDWIENAVAFRGRENVVKARVSFMSHDASYAPKLGPLTVDSIKIKEISYEETLDWADTLYAGMPRLDYKPEPSRWKFIPRTMKRLQEGGTIRIVMLGDSIVNDTGNSNFEVLLRRIYPKADIKIIVSVRGGTGCWYYQEPENFRSYVSDRKPDLLFIGGISQKNDLEAIRRVITMAKETPGCEIILASGPVGVDWRPSENVKPGEPLPAMEAAWPTGWEKKLEALAGELKVAYFDMATPWHRYLAQSGKPKGWFHRDRVHANDRGKQVLARLLEAFFTGDSR